ncbi:MAG: hypothetical protein Q4A24_10510 [Akkermansia sp.]|nr:hypothetical protein [Akkermansia sp.]
MTKIRESGRYSAALKGEKTIPQIASENSISPEPVRQWKKQAPEGVSTKTRVRG